MEEAANGLNWMEDGNDDNNNADTSGDIDDGSSSVDGVSPQPGRTPVHSAGIRTPRAHPEAESGNFFVGSC